MCDRGGSGRGLPADAHPHILLDFFFHFSSGLYSSGSEWTDFSVLTRVGFNIQTLASIHFLPLVLVRLSVNTSRNGDGCCVRLPGMLVPQLVSELLSRQMSGTRRPPPNGNGPILQTILADFILALGSRRLLQNQLTLASDESGGFHVNCLPVYSETLNGIWK